MGNSIEQNSQSQAGSEPTKIAALKRAEEDKFFLASIVESSEDSIITVNFDGYITSWNKAAVRGYRGLTTGVPGPWNDENGESHELMDEPESNQ